MFLKFFDAAASRRDTTSTGCLRRILTLPYHLNNELRLSMMKKQTRITRVYRETERILTVSGNLLAPCGECGRDVRLATLNEAARIAGVSDRTLYRDVESHRLHFIETSEGQLLICLVSLERLRAPIEFTTIQENSESE